MDTTKTINLRRASYFVSHPSAEAFFFTSDDQAFADENAARSHADIIKKRKGKSDAVVTITREEAAAWSAEQTGEDGGSGSDTGNSEEKSAEVIAAELKLGEAKAALEAAKTAQSKLPGNTGAAKRTAAEQAVNEAAAAVTAAEEALGLLTKKADGPTTTN
jgi:preprotein translocase subunit SecD